LTYTGQAAYISMKPSAYSNPFFGTLPHGMLYPSLILAVLAAIVASQALITSTFQLLSQVMNTSYFPHIKMIYTSDKFHGQVYIPMANWLMMIGTVIVTAVFNNVSFAAPRPRPLFLRLSFHLPSPCPSPKTNIYSPHARLHPWATPTASVSFSSPS
jgi:hypothetical protein